MTRTPEESAGQPDLRQVLDAVSDAFLLVDDSWRVSHINQGGRKMLERIGLDPETVLGGNLWKEVPSDPNGPGGVALRRAMENGTVESTEAYYAPLDSWFEITAFPDRENGGLIVLLTDVTGERETERALRDVEGRYRTMVEHAPHAIVVLDVESERVIDFNQRALELYDRTEEELKGSLPYQFSPERQPDGRRSVDAARVYIQRALDGEVPVFEWIHLRPGGEKVVTEIRLARIPPEDAKLIQASILDITERRRAEDALRESEELYRALFEQDVMGNFVTSADGELLACNRAFADIFDLGSPGEAVGRSVQDLHVSPEGRDHIVSLIQTEGRLEYYEFEGRSAAGAPLHLVANARGVFDEHGRLQEIRGHVVDTTERRRLEEQLQRAQRMEAIGRLAGGIAHDFNNLLTAVTGHTDLVLSDPRLPDELRDDLSKIKKASSRAARLTGQLVAFSRRDAIETTRVNLNEVVSEVVAMLRRVIGEDIRLEIQRAEDLWEIEADPTQMEQVVMNLAVNARDAMAQGGWLEIRTDNLEIPGDDEGTAGLHPPELDPGRYAVLEVEDSGEGIPEERLDRIFEPFYSTKGPGKGSGLGLAMVYGIVRRTGGQVRVASTAGEGTTFSIYLPAAPGSVGGDSPESGRRYATGPMEEVEGAGRTEGFEADGEARSAGARPTVLLLQHDPAVRNAVRRVLHRDGYSVLEAEDPAEAAAFFREWQGPIHAVVSDTLNDDDEKLVRSALARHRPPTPIVWTWERETETPPAIGPSDRLLRKPFSTQELSQRVNQILSPSTNTENRR